MQTELLNEMESVICERDRQEFALGDTLDIKTGLVVAVLTFLAIQSGELAHGNLSAYQRLAQAASVAFLVAGAILATIELYPRAYGREASPDKYQSWIEETEKLQQQYPNDIQPVTVDGLRSARLQAALQNIAANLAINKKKSKLMYWSFYCMMLAFAMNIITLAINLF